MILSLSIACALLALALFFAVAIIWSTNRLRHGEWKTLDAQDSEGPRFPEMVAHLTLSLLSDGNALELLENGDAFFEAAREAIGAATESVHFETFLWKTGELSATLVAAFCERARAGVEVRMIVDGEGGKLMHEDERKQLRDAGVTLAFFHPRTWRNIGTYNARDHRKIMIVDSVVAFAGGHCITDAWGGNAQDRDHNRDMSVRMRGPIVGEVQGAFAENWTEVTGRVLAGEKYFPKIEDAGDVRAHLAYVNTVRRVSAVKTLHVLAIAGAKRTLTIQNPYFIADDGSKLALIRAVERGVRVRVMTPTLAATDNGLPYRAMRYDLASLLNAGVEVYGYEKTLLHQKVLTVDGHWSLIGSTNFDFRSFEINDEVSVSVFDEAFAAQLEACFENDLAFCSPITCDEIEARGWVDRVKDRLAWGVREQL